MRQALVPIQLIRHQPRTLKVTVVPMSQPMYSPLLKEEQSIPKMLQRAGIDKPPEGLVHALEHARTGARHTPAREHASTRAAEHGMP